VVRALTPAAQALALFKLQQKRLMELEGGALLRAVHDLGKDVFDCEALLSTATGRLRNFSRKEVSELRALFRPKLERYYQEMKALKARSCVRVRVRVRESVFARTRSLFSLRALFACAGATAGRGRKGAGRARSSRRLGRRGRGGWWRRRRRWRR
jgi:hypothetical protein